MSVIPLLLIQTYYIFGDTSTAKDLHKVLHIQKQKIKIHL